MGHEIEVGSVLLVGLVGDFGERGNSCGHFAWSERRIILYDCNFIIYIYTYCSYVFCITYKGISLINYS